MNNKIFLYGDCKLLSGINGNQGYSSGGAGAGGGWTAPAGASNMTSAQRKEAEANGSAAQVQI